MFIDTDLESRIFEWRKFREQLEVSKTPYQDTVTLWGQAPRIDRLLEPWDSQRWPTPWELLKENRYCPIAIPLMMGWTLKLTTRFSTDNILIKICIDHNNQRYYNIVEVDNYVLNYKNDVVVRKDDLPSSLLTQYHTELL